MPLFICFCPDYPNSLSKRLSVREEHLALGRKDREAGTTVFGRAYIDPDTRDMAGSTLLYRYPSIEEAWRRIKADPYWTSGVWDQGKVEVKELPGMEGDDHLRVAKDL